MSLATRFNQKRGAIAYMLFSWLAKKNYKSVWGVGRHVLGSQIFDYWWDPTGFMIEACR